MITTKQKYNSIENLTITLAGLQNNSANACTKLDNTNLNYVNSFIDIKVKTASSGVNQYGYIVVYLLRSLDGINFDDGFSGSSGSFTPVNAEIIESLYVNPASQNSYEIRKIIDLSKYSLELTPYFAIGIGNFTGQALDGNSSNHHLRVMRYTKDGQFDF